MKAKVSKAGFLAAALSLLAACAGAAENDVLYWMVDSSATVTSPDGSVTKTISRFFEDMAISADSSFAARVRVVGGDITGDTFLDLYYPDGIGVISGDIGVDFYDTGSAYWGAGVPTGNQSPSGDYSAGTPEYSFIVELGTVLWGSGGTDPVWTTIAETGETSYSSLAEYIQHSFDLNVPQSEIWTPVNFTAVPEPSSGLLTLIGFALFALRRRRN